MDYRAIAYQINGLQGHCVSNQWTAGPLRIKSMAWSKLSWSKMSWLKYGMVKSGMSKMAWMIALGKEVMIALEEPAGEQGGKQWL